MKIKTQDLIGPALDWAVDEAQGQGSTYLKWWNAGGDKRFTYCEIMRAYSTDWSQGGPIIDAMFKDGLQLSQAGTGAGNQRCWASRKERYWHGPTPLIAAMRCYVASKLGDEVDIPDELKP